MVQDKWQQEKGERSMGVEDEEQFTNIEPIRNKQVTDDCVTE